MKELANKLFGVTYQWVVSLPWILLATVASLTSGLDSILRGNISTGILKLVFSPIVALLTFVLTSAIAVQVGWQCGFGHLFESIPVRIQYFFTQQIPFGINEGESVSDIFRTQEPEGLDFLFSGFFFDRLTLKLCSLCLPMEFCMNYQAGDDCPHATHREYQTENNLQKLHRKYHALLNRNMSRLLSIDEERGHISQKDEILQRVRGSLNRRSQEENEGYDIENVHASLRALDAIEQDTSNVKVNDNVTVTISDVFGYVCMAIEHESQTDKKDILYDRLYDILCQIQRSYNLTLQSVGGADLPECLGGQVALLTSVLIDNKFLKEKSQPDYQGVMTPTALTKKLKHALDDEYENTASFFKKAFLEDGKQQFGNSMISFWCSRYRNDKKLCGEIPALVSTGVDAWQPKEDGGQGILEQPPRFQR